MKLLVNLFILMAALSSSKANAQDYYHCSDLESDGYKFGDQSPIELNSHESTDCYEESPLQFHNYNRSFEAPAVLRNTGYMVNLQLPELKHASISGGPLLHEEYYAVSLHPHWGERGACGSEHYVDNKCCSMELHFVHIPSDCNSLEEAVARGKVAVVGILIQEDPSLRTEHDGLAQITQALRFIQNFNTSIPIKDLTLSKLLNNDSCQNHFNYQGSLTTLPYSEGVNWIVCAQIVRIPSAQYEEFLKLRDRSGALIKTNARGLQPKGWRSVCRTFDNGNCSDDIVI